MNRFFGYIVLLLVVYGCKQDHASDEHAHHADAPAETASSSSNDVMLTDTQIRLANIVTERVRMAALSQDRVLNGTLTVNERNTEVITSRVAGRIERLAVKEEASRVTKGMILYSLYSENLLTLQQELIVAGEHYRKLGEKDPKYRQFYDAAKRKIELLGFSAEQIKRMETGKKESLLINVAAPVSGIVREVSVTEGQYVEEGTVICKIENLQELWVEAELYPAEAKLVKTGDKVLVYLTGRLEPVSASVEFINPEIESQGQLLILRATLDNPSGQLIPGQPAQVVLQQHMKSTISLPSDAVIRDARGAHVYVQRGINTFRPQMVTTGLESGDRIEILSGLTEKDTVAVSGAYLLYSELILKSGKDPMASHQH